MRDRPCDSHKHLRDSRVRAPIAGQTRERGSDRGEQAGTPDVAQQAAQAAIELRRRADERKQKVQLHIRPLTFRTRIQ